MELLGDPTQHTCSAIATVKETIAKLGAAMPMAQTRGRDLRVQRALQDRSAPASSKVQQFSLDPAHRAGGRHHECGQG